MRTHQDFHYGAAIESRTGSPIACDDLGNNLHYMLAIVDSSGAVVRDGEGRYQRLFLANLREKGVEVIGVNNNPIITPGRQLTAEIGGYEVTVTSTSSQWVTFNGETPRRAPHRDTFRYPIIR